MTKTEAFVDEGVAQPPETSTGAENENCLRRGKVKKEKNNRTADPLNLLSSAEFKKYQMNTH